MVKGGKSRGGREFFLQHRHVINVKKKKDFVLFDFILNAFYAVILCLPIAAIEYKTSTRAPVKILNQAFYPYTVVTFYY